MNALVRKEIRSLMPAWLTGLALVIVPGTLSWIATHARVTPPDPVLVWLFGFAVLLVSLASFGLEFSAATFSVLLAQPIPRIQIWRIKITVLVIALLSLSLLFFLGFWTRPVAYDIGSPTFFVVYLSLIVACGFSGALWTTLLLRQVVLSFWVTLLAPAVVCLPVQIFAGHDGPAIGVFVAALGIYALLGFLFARYLFLRAQDVVLTGGNIPVPRLRGISRIGASQSVTSPLRVLILKEIQFHHVSLMMAVVVYVLHIAFIIVARIRPQVQVSDSTAGILAGIAFLLWGAIPFLLGSIAVAEERKLGTLESQLCLPIARWLQCAVKFAVAMLLSLVLTVLIPFIIDIGGQAVGGRHGLFAGADRYQALLIISTIVGSITAVSFYISTLTRNTLQAMGLAVVANVLTSWLVIWCLHPRVVFLGEESGSGPLFGLIGGPLLVGTAVWLALRNYGHTLVNFSRWRRNALFLISSLLVSFAVTGVTYNRAWELLMDLEPAHGVAQLSGPIRPEIIHFGPELLVLLPDGRLWASKHVRNEVLYQYFQSGQLQDAVVQIPSDGEFVDPKWLCIAGRYTAPVGIQSDGTLWRIVLNRTNAAAVPEMKRIGSDSDWKSAAAGGGFYLAVKTDGTLWSWRDSKKSASDSSPSGDWDSPRQVGVEKDWASVDATYNVAIGIKRDGSIWKWGQLQFGPRGEFYSSGGRHYAEPVRWDGDASDWIKLTGDDSCDIVVKRDGTMWAFAPTGMRVLGHTSGGANGAYWRVGHESDWADVVMGGNQLVALRKNGSFVQSDLYGSRFRLFGVGREWQPSKHSDWIAVAPEWSEMTMALAADGTLSCWFRGPNTDTKTYYLGPSRKPIWNLNVLANGNSNAQHARR